MLSVDIIIWNKKEKNNKQKIQIISNKIEMNSAHPWLQYGTSNNWSHLFLVMFRCALLLWLSLVTCNFNNEINIVSNETPNNFVTLSNNTKQYKISLFAYSNNHTIDFSITETNNTNWHTRDNSLFFFFSSFFLTGFFVIQLTAKAKS